MVDADHVEPDEPIEHVREILSRPVDFVTEPPSRGRNEYLVLPASLQPVRPSKIGNTTMPVAS